MLTDDYNQTKGWSAVMFAEYRGNTNTVSILRKAGASDKLTQKQRKKRDELEKAANS